MRTALATTVMLAGLSLTGCTGAEVDAGDSDGTDEAALSAPYCGEQSCVALAGAYVSHYTGPGCTGTESYYTPYFSGTTRPNPDGKRRSWDGNGIAGTILRTQTNRSYRAADGKCVDAWPSGNTLPYFVTIYRSNPCPAGSVYATNVNYIDSAADDHTVARACLAPTGAPHCGQYYGKSYTQLVIDGAPLSDMWLTGSGPRDFCLPAGVVPTSQEGIDWRVPLACDSGQVVTAAGADTCARITVLQ